MGSFSWKVKEEISSITPKTKNCCLFAFLYGMTFSCNKEEGYKIKTTFVENAKELNERLANLLSKRASSYLTSNREILISSDVIRYSTFAEIESSVFKCNACREHFFKGLFFACGSISSPEKSYRIDLAFSNNAHAKEIKDILNSLGINFNLTIRNSKTVLYVKREEIIEDFLALMGASNSAFEMINIKIKNEVRNVANRATNCDSANINKSLIASKKHIEAITFLNENNRINELPPSLREIANARLEYPDVNLSELGKKLSIPLSKSGVYHRLEKILKLTNELKK